jgi:hypothetical protein
MAVVKQGDRWIVFYTDGSVFTSANGTPWKAPRTDVQRIANCKEGHEKDWYNVQSYDYFYYEKARGGWNEAKDWQTVMLHLLRASRPLVVFGSMLSDREWEQTHKRMNEYCERHYKWLIGQSDEPPREDTY